MKDFTIYQLVEMVKEARADAKALKELRVRKMESLANDSFKWRESQKKELEQAVKLLKQLEVIQWETVSYIQSEIDTRDRRTKW